MYVGFGTKTLMKAGYDIEHYNLTKSLFILEAYFGLGLLNDDMLLLLSFCVFVNVTIERKRKERVYYRERGDN
jgi:hypothetical protein